LVQQIFEKPHLSNIIKIRPVGREFHVAGQTNMLKSTVAFRNFAKVLRNEIWNGCCSVLLSVSKEKNSKTAEYVLMLSKAVQFY
jgi:hypothetical protein